MINKNNDPLVNYLFILGDNAMMMGHRLSELCGHGPSLETDIACTNLSLDFFGQVRSYYQYAASIIGEGVDEDTIAYFRNEREFRNCIMTELPNTDFGYVICRQFLFDAYHVPLLEQLMNSKDETIAAIAAKSIKEAKYHKLFSGQWMKRLGDGTEESHQRISQALHDLYPYFFELFQATDIETQMMEGGIGADLSKVEQAAREYVEGVVKDAGLVLPDVSDRFARGKSGFHSEYLGYILTEFQSTQRAYPNMQW